MKTLFTIILVFASLFANAQGGVCISTNGLQPHPSAGLDVDFNNKGLLIPRVYLLSETDVSTIPSPAIGLMVYNLNEEMGQDIYHWSGGIWKTMKPSCCPVVNKQVTDADATIIFNTLSFSNGEFANVRNTDKVFVQLVENGTITAARILRAFCNNGSVEVVFDLNPSGGTKVNVMVMR